MIRNWLSLRAGGWSQAVICAGLMLLSGTRSSTQAPVSSPAMGEDDAQITFEAVTELVVLPVNVTNADGEFVTGLQASSFRVFEDGKLQRITMFEPEDLPVTVGLIVDHSSSMAPKLAAVSAAITSFANSSNPEDEMFVVDFSDRVWPEYFGGKLFTSNPKELGGALLSVGAQGQTALYDAVFEGLERARAGHRDKKALVVVSDGGDNASQHKYAEVLDLARQSQAVIYAIGLLGESGQEENPKVLKRLCQDTGGLAFFPNDMKLVSEISNRIAGDLRQQYTIGYRPEKRAHDRAFRKLEVKVSEPGLGKLRVRTRAGYAMRNGKQPAAEPKGPG